ncbi:hypothetical protein E3J74_06925 [Candidatus Bathyarchaeota archaeon]|nr:MAG: hypothetical protein E3J74_06925 [Candidatus Bathyarchaeota archaeon]
MARGERTIREVKYVKALTPQHIKETVRKYRGHPWYARIEVIVPGRKHTRIPAKTRECAKKQKVKIRRFWGFK